MDESYHNLLAAGVEKHLICKDNVLKFISEHDFEVLLLLGAGDLDNQASEIEKILRQKYGIAEKNR